MKFKRLYLRLSQTDILKASKRYHFDEHQKLFYEIYKKLVKQIQPVLYYNYEYFDRNRMIGIISLGTAPDSFIDRYQHQERFLEAYAVDCLSLELLSCSYKQLKEIVYREQRQFLENMHFCDTEELIALIPKLKQSWSSFPITVNDSGALLPSKTVVFYGYLGRQTCSFEHACKTCSRQDCIFRATTGEAK